MLQYTIPSVLLILIGLFGRLTSCVDVLHYGTTPNGFTAPPKGWNSFALQSLKDKPTFNQDFVVKQCDAMASYLGRYGYEYCSLDSGWSLGRKGDQYGRFVADPTLFDIRSLANHLHQKGLKLGLYILPGYFTDDSDKTIYGTNIKLRDITAKGDGQYLNARWNIDWEAEGAQEFCNSVIDLFASQGVDMLKLDYITPGSPGNSDPLPANTSGAVSCYHRAIKRNGRSIRLDISWGLDTNSNYYYNLWKTNADSLRLDRDINNYEESTQVAWKTVQRTIEQYRRYTIQAVGRGVANPLTIYPDLDNLFTGNNETLSGLDDFKRKAQFTHWLGAGANLILGSDIAQLDTVGFNMLSNSLALEIGKFTSKFPMRPLLGNDNIKKGKQYQAWVAGPDPSTGVTVLVFANYGTDGDNNLYYPAPTDEQVVFSAKLKGYAVGMNADYYYVDNVWEPDQSGMWNANVQFNIIVKHSNVILLRLTPSTTTKRQLDPITPTQSTYPISSPRCGDNKLQNFPAAFEVKDGPISPNELMYRIRNMLCNTTCSAPEGVPSNVTTSIEKGDDCEISVGITPTIEAYGVRQTRPVGPLADECWISTSYIIENCVKDGPFKGWWNGDHVYQFYELGFRPLNDKNSAHAATINISTYLSSYTGALPIPTSGHNSSRTASSSLRSNTSLIVTLPTAVATTPASTAARTGSAPAPVSSSESGAIEMLGIGVLTWITGLLGFFLF